MGIPAKENKMGTMPVHRLLLSMSLPMMISMIIQALYNVVDSYFVAQINQDAFTAVSVAFPIQNLMIAVGAGTGVGINALLSRSLGEKNFEEAGRAATNGVFLSLISYSLFLIFGLVGTRAFLTTQTADPEVLEYAVTYLSLCCILSFGIFGQFVFERLLQSTGKTMLSMITQGTGAIINIILDPIFIAKMGIAGAAVATVFGQIFAMSLAIVFNKKFNTEIPLRFKGFRPNLKTIGRIYAVGIPSVIMGSIASVMAYFLNMILNSLHAAGVTVFGAYFKLQSFIFMPVFGLNNGMVPIVAYNLGARQPKRITHTIRLSITYAMSIMLIGLAIFQLFPDKLAAVFNLTGDTAAVAVPALRTISLSFIFAGFCIIITSVFQATSHGILSLTVSVARQLIVLVPVAFLLAQSGNIDLVWFAFPIAELMSLALCIIFFIHLYKKEIKPLYHQQ